MAIKPLGVPSLVGSWEGVIRIKFLPPLFELEAGTPNYFGFSLSTLDSKAEKILEESEVGRDTKKSLTKVREDAQVQDGVWIQVYHIHFIELEHSAEEIESWKTKSAAEERLKNNQIFDIGERKSGTFFSSPSEDCLR